MSFKLQWVSNCDEITVVIDTEMTWTLKFSGTQRIGHRASNGTQESGRWELPGAPQA